MEANSLTTNRLFIAKKLASNSERGVFQSARGDISKLQKQKNVRQFLTFLLPQQPNFTQKSLKSQTMGYLLNPEPFLGMIYNKNPSIPGF